MPGSIATLLARVLFAGTARAMALAALSCLASCKEGASYPRDPTTEQAAAHTFARDEYCPIDDVEAHSIIPVPPAPPDIEARADRLALWQRAWELKARTDQRVLVEVTGCGTRATYSCWEVSVLATLKNDARRAGRGAKKVVLGATCLAENGYVSKRSDE